jgi:flagellar motility protein MotE (MotC chaperone)
VAVAVGLGFAASAILMPESLDWVMNHVEIGLYGEAVAATDSGTAKEEKAAAGTAKSPEKAAGEKDVAKAGSMSDTRGWSQEELSFFNKLGERKRELDLREAELNKLEEELQKQRVELGEKLNQLEAMRSQIAQTLKSRVDNDQQKVSKLVEVYSGMKPSQAAKVMETINEELAVQVLDRMKKKSAADILNVMNADKAQRLSETLAGYKKTE